MGEEKARAAARRDPRQTSLFGQGHEQELQAREAPKNLHAEPPYPGLETVCFSIRSPDWTCHMKSLRCEKDWPHELGECGEWQDG